MMLTSMLRDPSGQIEWLTIVLLLFAVAFLVIGVVRAVEFKGLGFSRAKLTLLISVHVVGCLLFSAAICLAALDPLAAHRIMMNILFFTGLACLFPGQIHIAFLRRQRPDRPSI
jgi:hypothetical protein